MLHACERRLSRLLLCVRRCALCCNMRRKYEHIEENQCTRPDQCELDTLSL